MFLVCLYSRVKISRMRVSAIIFFGGCVIIILEACYLFNFNKLKIMMKNEWLEKKS